MNGTLVLSDTIRKMCNDGLTTQAELAEIAHVSESTVSRWTNDIGGPDVSHFFRWIQHHPRLEVRRAFHRCVPVVDTPLDADINGDGVVNHVDVIDGARELVLNTARMNYIMTTAAQNGDISEHEAGAICEAGDLLIGLGRALNHAAKAAATRRRPARV